MADQCGWDEIHAWVAAHRDALPQTLKELSRYPMIYRRAIIGAVSPAVREAMWHEHLSGFLGPEAGLSPAQQACVREMMAALSTLMAEDRQKAQPLMEEIEERISTLFSREQAGSIFATLGPPEPPEGLPIPAK